ncbi:FG-GAP repeat protein [Planomonospora sp. ID67723]|uniref:FG-GAP repeat protein n=1 Tax=Planomonospora sp. ID67723 TaxID=2738134 RepID=UPI0018C3F9E8|nr:FG-GAP repeat protein [Planomonospora sp. ID67723]MBG0831207.1 FG-GAP repeat protein [Planomonospora sp. ID67723]
MALVAVSVLTVHAPAVADAARGIGDFNADGFDDLVVASPLEDVGGVQDAGVVRIFYGGPDGPASGGVQTITQNSGNLGGNAEPADRLGAAIAVGDFLFGAGSELVIGVPGEDDDEIAGDQADSGVIHILTGGTGVLLNASTAITLDPVGAQLGLAEVEAGDQWGAALAVGRAGRSGSDLAVGGPGEDLAVVDAGAVDVLHFEGGVLSGARRLHQDESLVEGVAAAGDRFGAAVAMGNFDGDSFDDLAVGVPADQQNSVDPGGEVNVFYGASPVPLTGADDQLWAQGALPGGREPEDAFGAALAVGDFDGGPDDLVIGAPGETGGSGVVHVVYGTAGGLGTARTQLWSQSSAGVSETSDPGDRFGAVLAAGDFNGDNQDDLAIGVPEEDREVDNRSDVGGVNVLYGENDGPNSPDDPALGVDHQQFFVQISIGANAEQGDRFGAGLAAGDYDDNGEADLAAGVPGENVSGAAGADHGQVNVVYGKGPIFSFGGLDPDSSLTIQRPATPQAGGQFGAVLR